MRKVVCLSALLFALAGPVAAERLLIAFTSNLNSTGGCHRDDLTGGDLYTVVLDLDTMRVSNLTRITQEPSGAEWFSSVSPDGRFILFNRTRFAPRRQDLLVYDRKTGSEQLLVQAARFPHWFSNTEFYYTNIRGRQNCHRAEVAVADGKLKITRSEAITSQERCPGTSLASDPSPFPDGSRIAFHVLRGRPGAAVALINTDGTGFRRITPWNGAGHCDVSPSGDYLVFSMASVGTPHLLRRSDDWKQPQPLPVSTDPKYWVSYEPRYASMERVGWDYGEWAGSDHRLLISGQGYARRKTRFSRLFLFTFSEDFGSAEIFDFSSAVEKLAGKSGRDFCTGFPVLLKGDRASR